MNSHVDMSEQYDDSRFVPMSISLNVALKRWRHVMGVTILTSGCAVVIAMVLPPTYASTSQLLIENHELKFARDDSIIVVSQIDSPLIETQVQILSSNGVARKVVENLGLIDSNYFSGSGILSGFMNKFRSHDGALNQEIKKQDILTSFQRNLSVTRQNLSYVINVTFKSTNAEESAKIADEVVSVYQHIQREDSAASAKSASAWLQTRLSQLGTRALVLTEAKPTSRSSGVPKYVLVLAGMVTGLLLGVGSAGMIEFIEIRHRSRN